MVLYRKFSKAMGIAAVSMVLFPSMVSAQFYTTTSPPPELPAPVFNGGFNSPQELPPPVFDGRYSQYQELPPPVYNGGSTPIPAPQPAFDYWQAQPVPLPYPNNYGGDFTIPNSGPYAPMPQEDAYRNEVEAYRSIGQVSPIFNGQPYDAYVPPAQTFVPSNRGSQFTIAPLPQVFYLPQAASMPNNATLRQQNFNAPRSPQNTARSFTSSVPYNLFQGGSSAYGVGASLAGALACTTVWGCFAPVVTGISSLFGLNDAYNNLGRR